MVAAPRVIPLYRYELKDSLNLKWPLSSLQEKDREKKEKEGKEKDKKTINGHLFTHVCLAQASHCSQCNKAFNSKEAYHCTRKWLRSLLTSSSSSLSAVLRVASVLFDLSLFVTD